MLNVYNWYCAPNFLYRKKMPFLPMVISYLIRLVFSAWIPHTALIGRGTVFGYGGLGIVIHNRAVIGEFCHIDQNVTIGGSSKKYEVPVIGDYVYIGAGAKILGPIKIGNNVVIGANAVVVKDIPDGCLAVGVPARIVKHGILMKDYV
jgi:serine O-acetyltransferase